MKLFKNINKDFLKLILLVLIFPFTPISAQTITPQVINSAGGNWILPNGITVSDNVGEPFV